MTWQPIPCPVCGRTGYREGRSCPKLGGGSMCIACCKTCECHKEGKTNPCGFYIMYPQIDYDSEIRKLNNRIEHLRDKVRYYYKRNWTQSALKIEKEIEELLRERRRMEAQQKDEKHERNNQDSGTGGICDADYAVFYGSGRAGNSSRY